MVIRSFAAPKLEDGRIRTGKRPGEPRITSAIYCLHRGGTHAGLPARARVAERFISTAHVLVSFASRSSSFDCR